MKHLSNYQVIQTLTDRQKDAIIRSSIEAQTIFMRQHDADMLFNLGIFTDLKCLAIDLGLFLVRAEIDRWERRELWQK